ncbi:MAG: hypothetical protein IT357_18475 [Gemmatimonadaceae bacterium]|nr:hypothetical protein [Gemmatimonadaceae bacterium]
MNGRAEMAFAPGDHVLTPTGNEAVVLQSAGHDGRLVLQYVNGTPAWQPRGDGRPVPSAWAGTVTLRASLLRPAPVREPEHVAARRAARADQ